MANTWPNKLVPYGRIQTLHIELTIMTPDGMLWSRIQRGRGLPMGLLICPHLPGTGWTQVSCLSSGWSFNTWSQHGFQTPRWSQYWAKEESMVPLTVSQLLYFWQEQRRRLSLFEPRWRTEDYREKLQHSPKMQLNHKVLLFSRGLLDSVEVSAPVGSCRTETICFCFFCFYKTA